MTNYSQAGREANRARIDTDYQKYIEQWKAGAKDGRRGHGATSRHVHRYMLERCGFACEECGFSKRHPIDNKPILTLDHIDGDASNNAELNLRVLCPNCHMMTPTFGNRNKREGGSARRRYRDKNYDKYYRT